MSTFMCGPGLRWNLAPASMGPRALNFLMACAAPHRAWREQLLVKQDVLGDGGDGIGWRPP